MLSNVKRPRGRPRGSKSKVKPVVVTWRDSLILNPGDVLLLSGRTRKGNLDQFESETYDVLDAQGLSVGTVEYTASTPLTPPFRTRYSLVQKDTAGTAIIDRRW